MYTYRYRCISICKTAAYPENDGRKEKKKKKGRKKERKEKEKESNAALYIPMGLLLFFLYSTY